MTRVRTGEALGPFVPNESTIVLSTDQWVRIIAFMVKFNASSATGNRFPFVSVTDLNGNVYSAVGSETPVAADNWDWIHAGPGLGANPKVSGPDGGGESFSLPRFWMPPGWGLSLGATSGLAGDTFTNATWIMDSSESVWSSDLRAIARRELLEDLEAEG